MNFLNRNKKPDERQETKATDQQTAIGEMSGFRGLEDVKRNAPVSTATAQPSTQEEIKSREQGAKRVATVQTKNRTKKEQELAEAEKRAKDQERALETIGKSICNKLASIPYEVWAAMAADPALKLTPDEQKELADSYFLFVQSMNPDFTKPVWLIGGIILMNSVMISQRLKYMNDKLAQDDAIAAANEQRPN